MLKVPRIRDDTFEQNCNAFKETLRNHTDIEELCYISEVPGRQILWDAGGIRRAGSDRSEGKNYLITAVDYAFVDVFDLELAAGRNFSRHFPGDKDGLLLNETAVSWMGFENATAAIGQQVDYWGKIYTIVGVLKDYHQQSVKEEIGPRVYRLMPSGSGVRGVFALKIKGADTEAILDEVRRQYVAFFPGNPFDYFFLDTWFDEQYRGDRLFGAVVANFSILALLITCLGIFGLSSFRVHQRTREIGIRKVIGASVAQIIVLLTMDFVRLLIVAAIIAVPITWALAGQWLSRFAIHMDPDPVSYLPPLIVVAGIALLTSGFHSMKAALTSPALTLKH